MFGRHLVVRLAELTPGTLLRYFAPNAAQFSDGTKGDIEFIGIVVWHKRYDRGVPRRIVAVIWDNSANESYNIYENDLNSMFVSVVQTV